MREKVPDVENQSCVKTRVSLLLWTGNVIIILYYI